jgi:hypothetical protein
MCCMQEPDRVLRSVDDHVSTLKRIVKCGYNEVVIRKDTCLCSAATD